MGNIVKDFPVDVYSLGEKFSDTISKGRCRLFYRGKNRNHSYITDEFADKLISTITYTPVKGIFDDIDQDYTDHGKSRTQGRIYGIVPKDYNFAWEKHLDSDGVEREYACVDALFYTGIYGEAELAKSKGQSMELYEPSIKGEWVDIDGEPYYKFTEGSFLGLQILGDDVEPCFEGASFFTLYEALTDLVNVMDSFQQKNCNQELGGNKMQITFKLSDNQKFSLLWNALNANFNEENGWLVEYDICEVYDDYALVKNYGENKFQRIYYTKDEANESVVLGNVEDCFIVDVNSQEKQILNLMQENSIGTYEAAEQHFAEITNLKDEFSKISTQNQEYIDSLATLKSEKEELSTSFTAVTDEKDQLAQKFNELQAQFTQLSAEKDELAKFKYDVELNEKMAVIDSYKSLVSEDVINVFVENIDCYTALDLDMQLTYAAKKANPTAFSATGSQPAYVPKEQPLSGLEAILSVYEKRK